MPQLITPHTSQPFNLLKLPVPPNVFCLCNKSKSICAGYYCESQLHLYVYQRKDVHHYTFFPLFFSFNCCYKKHQKASSVWNGFHIISFSCCKSEEPNWSAATVGCTLPWTEKDGSKTLGKISNSSVAGSCSEGHEVVIPSSTCVCGINVCTSNFAITTLPAEELLCTFQNWVSLPIGFP